MLLDDLALHECAFCSALQSPPTTVSAEERHQAELFFLEFRKTTNPFALCREILGKFIQIVTYRFILFNLYHLSKFTQGTKAELQNVLKM